MGFGFKGSGRHGAAGEASRAACSVSDSSAGGHGEEAGNHEVGALLARRRDHRRGEVPRAAAHVQATAGRPVPRQLLRTRKSGGPGRRHGRVRQIRLHSTAALQAPGAQRRPARSAAHPGGRLIQALHLAVLGADPANVRLGGCARWMSVRAGGRATSRQLRGAPDSKRTGSWVAPRTSQGPLTKAPGLRRGLQGHADDGVDGGRAGRKGRALDASGRVGAAGRGVVKAGWM